MRITYQLMACLVALAVSATAAAATTFDKQVDAEARGVVEISNTSGSVEVSGWDKPQVSVHAELGGAVERVEVTSEPGRTLIKVLVPGHSWGDGEAKLHVQVPKGSELHLSTVSANANVSGVLGVQRLTVVSGDVVTEIAGADLELKSVSGDVKVRGHGQSARLYVSSVSGDVHLEHGAGDLEISSVSGTLAVTLDSARLVRARTTSGDLRFEGKLTRAASFEATSVSGDLKVRAPAEGGYSYDLSSFSGDIDNCFGAKREKSSGVGHSLSGTLGEGAGHVRLKTMSGDIELCDRS
jgi:DUF4097 and DUF4098 domain-containing protein YvlB